MPDSLIKKMPGMHHGAQLLRGFDHDEKLGCHFGPMIQDCKDYFDTKKKAVKTPPGRFGRIFPTSQYSPEIAAIHELAERTLETDLGSSGELTTMPAGFVFLGQFIDHDITFDPTSFLTRMRDPAATQNFRSPNVDLDNIFGAGPDASRHLFNLSTDDQHQIPYRLLLDAGREFDLPRNSQSCALIGDPRNDENFMISQLQLAMLKFYNAVVDWVIGSGEPPDPDIPRNKWLFDRCREITRWHYQWIILHEFLPLIVGQEMINDVLQNGPIIYKWKACKAREPFVPVEFGGAVYRFGHTLIRENYKIAASVPAQSLFKLPFFGQQRPEFTHQIEWWRFFDFSSFGQLPPQYAREFDRFVAPALHSLPFINKDEDPPGSLPERNMLRGLIFNLPSGQEAANLINEALAKANRAPIPVYSNADLDIDDIVGLKDEAPLWFYALAESEQSPTDSQHLGPVGGRIVAEVLISFLKDHEGNYLHDDPEWTPILPSSTADQFTMVDLLRFAGA